MTRSELRLQAAVLDELVQHVQRLDGRLAALVEGSDGDTGTPAPSSDLTLHRIEAGWRPTPPPSRPASVG